MLDAPQPSHEENSFKSCLTWLKCSKTGFGPHLGKNGLKLAFWAPFLQNFVETTKFSSTFYLSTLKTKSEYHFQLIEPI